MRVVVVRSIFLSENVHPTSASDGFWKLRCRKSIRRVSKSKVLKIGGLGLLLEVEMSKKCTPLWREVRFQIKIYKTPQRRTAFGSYEVEKVHAVVARNACPRQKC